MKRFVSLLAAAVVVISIAAVSSGTDGYSKAATPDGTVYSYETYGSDYSTYKATIFHAESDATVLYISTVLEGYNVTEISTNAFSGCTDTRAVVIPEKVGTIGAGAFSGCTSLKSVYFLGNAPVISSNAFPSDVRFLCTEGSSGWAEYKTSYIEQCEADSDDGSAVTYYIIENEGMAAKGSPSPEGSVTILPEIKGYPVTSVGPYSFSGRDNAAGTDVIPVSGIKTVLIPEGVEIIRERAFYYNTGLENIHLPQSLTAIMDEAFRAASRMGTVDMPDGIGYIGFESFRQCSSMEKIAIPDSTTFVGEGAFKICSGADSITIGKGVSSIMPWTFAYCSSASDIELKGEVYDIGDSAFYMCGSLVSVVLPDTLISIGSSAFFQCTSLKKISLGNSLVSIGSSAFSECSVLNSVHIPETVASVSSRAFSYCTEMTDIYFAGIMPEFGNSVFLNTDVMVHCTRANSDSWDGFDGRIAADSYGGLTEIAIFAVVLFAVVIIGAVFVRYYTK